jgi:hypothetical protein
MWHVCTQPSSLLPESYPPSKCGIDRAGFSKTVSISTAVQRDGRVDVYNQENKLVGSHLGQLLGYTSRSVSVKRNGTLDTYDENGMQISSTRAP